MCVIVAVPENGTDITQDEWNSALTMNNDGYGVAWLQKGLVHFRKLLWKEAQDISTWRPPKPYVMHFRMATIGEEKPELCHPFIVSNNSKLVTRGRARQVLFHNGHWNAWNEWLAITYSGKGKLPSGTYSDSRAIAMMVGHYGEEILDISGVTNSQKIMLFNNRGEIITHGGGWDFDKDGTVRSNTYHIDSINYGDWEGYGQYDSLKSNEQNILSQETCIMCSVPYYQYQTDSDDNICYSCEKRYMDAALDKEKSSTTNLTSSVKSKPLINKNRNCPVCGRTDTLYISMHVPNMCSECQKEEATGKCMGCDTYLYQQKSIASGCCDKCRHDGDFSTAEMHVIVWERIQNTLTSYDSEMYWIPASLIVWHSKDSGYNYHLAGRKDNKPEILVSGTVRPAQHLNSVTLTVEEYTNEERISMGADPIYEHNE